jgi:iduronate 2-sulfatase
MRVSDKHNLLLPSREYRRQALAMNRNRLRASIVAALSLASVIASTTSFAASPKPNILFISIDDLRPELGCYGADYIKSPHIDRLAAEGVLFERAYCQWAVCMPSRASLLTGLRPDSFKGRAAGFRRIVPDVVTLPQHFKNNGYFTQSYGKIFHGQWDMAYTGNSHQDPISWSAPRWTSSPQYYFSPEGIRIAKEVFANGNDKFLRKVKRDPNDPNQWKKHFVRGPASEAPDVPDNLPADGRMTDVVIEKLRRLNQSRTPFFLGVGFAKPHLPFIAPKRYWDLYDPEEIPPVTHTKAPKGTPAHALTSWGELRAYTDMPKKGDLNAEQTRRLRHGYAACVSYVDAQIGRLLAELDALGIRGDTIIVLWSDHGFKLGDFGDWCKHTNFELDTRVALIVSAPGLARGARSQALVELVDLHPTLSELAGLPVLPAADGVSFAPIVRDPTAPGEDAAFSQYPRSGQVGYSIRTSTHRYTEWRGTKDATVAATELYNYGPSGIEEENLSGRPELAAKKRELQRRLKTVFR